MAFTIDLTVARARAVFGNRRQTIGKLTGPASYTTGGETLAAGDIGLGEIEYFSPTVIQTATACIQLVYNYTTGKLQAFWRGAAAAAGSQIVNIAPGGGDIKGSGNTNAANTDQNALVTNGALLFAVTGFSTFVTTMTATANPDVGRNLAITIANEAGTPLNLYEGVTTFLATGTWRGAAQTESITLTSTAGNKSVVNTKFRVVYGSKPFDTLTTVEVTNVPAAGFSAGVGIGSKIGLPVDLFTPAEADVQHLTKNAASLSPSGIVDTTNMTVNFGTLADGDDIGIVYKTGIGSFTAVAWAEVSSGANLSTYIGRFEAVGK